MATNQDIQKKLQDEIDKYFPADEDAEPCYDNVMKMEYLDMVWCETLRKYPLASTYVIIIIFDKVCANVSANMLSKQITAFENYTGV